MYFHFGQKKTRCRETTIIYTLGHSVFNERLSITQFEMKIHLQSMNVK